MLGALDNQTSARLVPLQETNLRGYAAYFQDDFDVSDRLTSISACAGSTNPAQPIR